MSKKPSAPKKRQTMVYAVSSGSYSDYRVNEVFSTRALADEYVRVVGRLPYADDYRVEEYEVDPPTVRYLRDGLSVWSVTMLRDGTVECVERTDNSVYDVGDSPDHQIWQRTKVPAYKGKGIPDALQSKVWARNKKHAVKIVNEHRAEMIASGEWP